VSGVAERAPASEQRSDVVSGSERTHGVSGARSARSAVRTEGLVGVGRTRSDQPHTVRPGPALVGEGSAERATTSETSVPSQSGGLRSRTRSEATGLLTYRWDSGSARRTRARAMRAGPGNPRRRAKRFAGGGKRRGRIGKAVAPTSTARRARQAGPSPVTLLSSERDECDEVVTNRGLRGRITAGLLSAGIFECSGGRGERTSA